MRGDEFKIERTLHDEVFSVVHPCHWHLGHFHHSETLKHPASAILGVRELHRQPGLGRHESPPS